MSQETETQPGRGIIHPERVKSIKRSWSKIRRNYLSVLGGIMVLGLVLVAIFAPYLAPYPEHAGKGTYFEQANESPSWEHPMGTDNVGRDIFSRVIFGARLSLIMAVVVLSGAITIGIVAGLTAAYFGGLVETVIMRVVDIFLAIPPILLAMGIVAALGPGMWNVMIALMASWWTWYARLMYGEALSIKQEEYVEAIESVGAGPVHVMIKEILPNAIAPITVKGTLDVGIVILVAAGLSFLGLGASAPTPDWGTMIADGRVDLSEFWWISTMPGIAVSFTTLAFNFLGDGLRDILDVEVEVNQ
jgi:peptide/nickel transport system permease protein